MKVAYKGEVSATSTALEAVKTELETWYAQRIPDNQIVGAVKETYDGLMARADGELNSFAGTAKTIRSAVIPNFNIDMKFVYFS